MALLRVRVRHTDSTKTLEIQELHILTVSSEYTLKLRLGHVNQHISLRGALSVAAHSYGCLRVFVKYNGWYASYVERTGLPSLFHVPLLSFSAHGIRLHFVL